jgi:hypothetical protein
MTKYAFTYSHHREVCEFVGPFDSYEKMMEALISLAEDHDYTSIGDVIEDSLFVDHDLEYLQGSIDIHIYKVEEQEFTDLNFSDLCDEWRWSLEKQNKKIADMYAENERQEYERLKKKFEGK